MTPPNLERRAFLRTAGLAGLTLSSVRGMALAGTTVEREKRPTLVFVFLRGGIDGLNLIVPHGEAAYYRLRPQLGIRPPGSGEGAALDLDGFFGLHPAATALKAHFDSGLASCVHAVGSKRNTRSHFEEQDRWETAVDGADLETTGWLGRYLSTGPGWGPVRAIALGDRLPRSMRGEVTTLALRGLDDLVPQGAEGMGSTLTALHRAYGGGASSLLAREGRASLEALELLEDVARNPPASKVTYPDTDPGRRARELARLVRAEVGLEVVELDFGGWDTHQNQGGAQGAYANNLRQVAEALDALVRDLEDRMDDLMIVTVSEFGRTAAQNGTLGTDHGNGNCMLALGGPIAKGAAERGGPVLGTWPGLEREELNQERDLEITTDYRDVYRELLGFLGCTDVERVLPGHAQGAGRGPGWVG